MELIWDDEALADLEDIFNWIAQAIRAAVYEVDRAQQRVVVTAVVHGAQDR